MFCKLSQKEEERKRESKKYNQIMQKTNRNQGKTANTGKRRIETASLQVICYSPGKIIPNMGSLIKKATWKSSSTNSGIAELAGCCFVLLQTKINVA